MKWTNTQQIIRRIIEGGIMSPSEEKQKENKGNHRQYPKVPSGFECFVCGKNSVQMKREYSILKKMLMEVCMILPHLRKEKTLDDFNNTQEDYLLRGSNAKWKE